MAGARTPVRVVMVALLSVQWHVWISSIAFPFGGGEAHWVTMRIRPVGFTDGLFLGGLYAVAGASLAIVLKARRIAVALLVGVIAPGLVLVGTVEPEWSVADVIEALAFYGFPIAVYGLVAVLSRVNLGWMGIGAVAWWPGFLHLPLYLRASGLPEGFRNGVGLMWVVGGLIVGAVARGRGIDEEGAGRW